MINAKRLIIAALLGIIAGFICFGLASSGSPGLPWPVAAQIIASRTLIGIAIGVSCLAVVPWPIHGALMGLLFSIPLSFSGLMAPENPEFSQTAMFVSTVVMGMIYGFVIELITSLIFKARIKQLPEKAG